MFYLLPNLVFFNFNILFFQLEKKTGREQLPVCHESKISTVLPYLKKKIENFALLK